MQSLFFDISYFPQNEWLGLLSMTHLFLDTIFLFKNSLKPSNLKPIVLAGLSNAFR